MYNSFFSIWIPGKISAWHFLWCSMSRCMTSGQKFKIFFNPSLFQAQGRPWSWIFFTPVWKTLVKRESTSMASCWTYTKVSIIPPSCSNDYSRLAWVTFEGFSDSLSAGDAVLISPANCPPLCTCVKLSLCSVLSWGLGFADAGVF